MALKFRLKGLAETFIDDIECPCCGIVAGDDENFSTELTRVTYEGIIVVLQCRHCNEIFVPEKQRLGIINVQALKEAVKKDSQDTGEPLYTDVSAVVLNAEKLNAIRRGAVH